MLPTGESKYNKMNGSRLYNGPVFASMNDEETIREQEAQDAIREFEQNQQESQNVIPSALTVLYKGYEILVTRIPASENILGNPTVDQWIGEVPKLSASFEASNFDNAVTKGKKVIDDFLKPIVNDEIVDEVVNDDDNDDSSNDGSILQFVGIGFLSMAALAYFFLLDGTPDGY